MPNTYDIKRVVAYERGKQASISDIKQLAEGEKYLEVLVPFSDPIAESPELQDASVRAMEHPHTTDDIFDLLCDLKEEVLSKIILSIYLNTAFAYGYDDFCKRAKESGVFALNIKDMPFKERQEVEPYAEKYGLVTLASNNPETLSEILSASQSVVYASAAMRKKYAQNELEELLSEIKDDRGIDVLIEN